jgi:PAS domain S-box-containing protein
MLRKSTRDALRASEREIRTLIEAANSIILRLQETGIITFINSFGLSFFGYTEEDLIGKHVGILVPEQEASGRDLTNLVQNVADNPQAYTNFTNENVLKDGTIVTVNWSNKAIYDENGNLREILAIGTDITEQTRIQEA